MKAASLQVGEFGAVSLVLRWQFWDGRVNVLLKLRYRMERNTPLLTALVKELVFKHKLLRCKNSFTSTLAIRKDGGLFSWESEKLPSLSLHWLTFCQ